MESYDTLTDALTALRKKGYTEDFNLSENCLVCNHGKYKLYHDDFHIDAYYRFEGMTDPDDQTILYAISSPKMNVKGVLVNAYGMYSESMANEMVRKLSVPEQ